MTAGLPRYYFRLRDNGAAVFRVDTENRERRLELDQIAAINLRQGSFRPQGDTVLSAEDTAAIEDWIAARQALEDSRRLDDVHRTIDQINRTAQWAQSQAAPEELAEVTDALLLAMHDLRTVLVRKKAETVE